MIQSERIWDRKISLKRPCVQRIIVQLSANFSKKFSHKSANQEHGFIHFSLSYSEIMIF